MRHKWFVSPVRFCVRCQIKITNERRHRSLNNGTMNILCVASAFQVKCTIIFTIIPFSVCRNNKNFSFIQREFIQTLKQFWWYVIKNCLTSYTMDFIFHIGKWEKNYKLIQNRAACMSYSKKILILRYKLFIACIEVLKLRSNTLFFF